MSVLSFTADVQESQRKWDTPKSLHTYWNQKAEHPSRQVDGTKKLTQMDITGVVNQDQEKQLPLLAISRDGQRN